MLDKFADELRSQREKSGQSLEQLAAKTRIDIRFLEAIDQGNFAFLPDLYVKAFLKQYAKTVGLDENETIKKFEIAKQGKDFNETVEAEKIQQQNNVQAENKPDSSSKVKSFVDSSAESKPETNTNQTNRNYIIGLIAIVSVFILVVLYVFIIKSEDDIVVNETPIEDVIKGENEQRYVVNDSETLPENNTAATTDSLHLTFLSTDTSWIYVIRDNKKVDEYTLYPNSKITVSALDNFKATIGNSGGITLQLNNNPVQFTGRSGAVKHFQLDRNGIVYLNTPPKPEQ